MRRHCLFGRGAGGLGTAWLWPRPAWRPAQSAGTPARAQRATHPSPADAADGARVAAARSSATCAGNKGENSFGPPTRAFLLPFYMVDKPLLVGDFSFALVAGTRRQCRAWQRAASASSAAFHARLGHGLGPVRPAKPSARARRDPSNKRASGETEKRSRTPSLGSH